ncbi:hypothetical protein J2T55_002399 [Methylohalomonas lacus]|uniref:Sulfotransferase family protein n=1 Tax=Methylohalomonas lacus TaxID=398773 RepID=A0AAE3HPC8_9GAMM|nr:hypothetical protein [Methylohalomonas lacus]MCS3904363.1 hypothetical protein [Methylohalomonas lacus]
MKKLLLHIGAPKTGTTSIQEALFNASIRGELKDIDYPAHLHPWMRGNHRFVELLYSDRNRQLRRYTASSLLASLVTRQIVRSLNKQLPEAFARSDSIILSAENFSSLPVAAIQRLHDHMKELGVDETAVVYYVREPASSYLSDLQQLVKTSGNLKSFSKYYSAFRQNIERWASVYGDRLIVRPYDSSLLHEYDVVEDFVHIAEQFFGRELSLTDRPRANTSISAEGMFILNEYRKRYYPDKNRRFKADTNMLTHILQKRISFITQNRPVLKQNIINIVQANHHENLKWLKENWCPDFPVQPDPPAIADATSAEETGALTVDDIIVTRSPEQTCKLIRYIMGNTDRHWLASGHMNRPWQPLSRYTKFFLVPFHFFRRWFVTRLLQYRLWKLAHDLCD